MNLESINVKATESRSSTPCKNRQTATVSNPVIGSQNCHKRVHFAAIEANCEGTDCSNEDESVDLNKQAKRRSETWYTEKDYDDFKTDRVATIRLFRSLQGDMDEVLEDFYCIRGLEPFHSPSLQSELCVHRAIYVNAVLSEQRRATLQKIRQQILCDDEDMGDGSCLADAIRRRIEHVSKWSMQRAQRLAVLDEMDAQEINGGNSRRRSSWAPMKECKRRRRDSIPFLLQGPDRRKSFSITSQANLLELKEMNRRMIHEMGARGLGSLTRSESSKSLLPETDVMSLNSLMQASIIKTKCDALFPPLPIDYLQQRFSTKEIQTKQNV